MNYRLRCCGYACDEKAVPIGIIPKHHWLSLRKSELSHAIQRYLDAGLEVPAEWITEYNELAKDGVK